MIQVEVSAPVNPTEDPEKVAAAISKLFLGIKLEKKSEQKSIEQKSILVKEPEKNSSSLYSLSYPFFFLSGQGGLDILLSLHELVRKEAIIDSLREKVFNKRLSEDDLSVRFLLNKQAAFAGVLSTLAEEEPLGSIEVIIKADSPEELRRLIEWLLPLTEAGKPVVEVGIEHVERR